MSLCVCSDNDPFPLSHYHIASDKDYWNNCTVAQISLKLHKLTG